MKDIRTRVWDGEKYQYVNTLKLNAGIDYELCTGEEDGNDKYIYENDLVADTKGYVGVVKHSGARFFVDINGRDECLVEPTWTVVGNVHEGKKE